MVFVNDSLVMGSVNSLTLTVVGGKSFDLVGFTHSDFYDFNENLTLTTAKGAVLVNFSTSAFGIGEVKTFNDSKLQGITSVVITRQGGGTISPFLLDDVLLDNIGLPGAPTSPVATAGNGQATVTFTAPASNGGSAITSYTATASSGGATGSCAGPSACPITVTGLTNGTAYTFTVTATNAIGTSAASVASNSITPKASQTITFTDPGAQNFGTSPTLSATSTSGLTPTFTSSTTGVCTITSGGALTFVTAGTCTIDADQAGNGTYNAATTVSRSFTVNAVAPGAPTIGTATAGNTQASVAFTAPASNGGAAITGYTVTANTDGATATGAASPITITGLTNGTAYTFTVTATNAIGTSAASFASNSVTPKASQTITFTNPGAQNFGTTPTLSATSTSGLTPTFTSSTAGVCTITSGGALTFVTAGTCTINADQAGNGTYNAATTVSRSFSVNAVAPGAPTIGTATAGDTQASVAFTAPASNGGAAITGYTVTADPGGASANGATSPITVTGLTNGTAFTFTVRATNSAGPGGTSSASNSVTPKAAQIITFANPGTQNFGTTPTLTATSDSSLTPSFTSSTTGVCTITSGGSLTFVAIGTCTINADEAGNGTYLPASQVSRSFTVAPVAPGAPTGVTATAGDTLGSVSFTAPAFNGGTTITGYTVTSNPGGLTGTGAGSPVEVTGLTNGIAYTFTVTATNTAGTGSASAASNSVTPQAGPTVVSVAVPTNGSYGVGRTLDFTVTWNENVTVTGMPRIALVIGATTVHADYVSSPTGSSMLFRYTVLAGQTDANGIAVSALTLNGGSIRSSLGISATLTLNSVGSTSSVLVETVAPSLPAANIVVNNQSDPHKVVLTFSENLDAATLGAASGWAVTGNGGTPSYSIASVTLASGNVVTLTLNSVDVGASNSYITNTAANAHLKVTPPATLKDGAGNLYAAGLVTESGATHVLDVIAPTLSSVSSSSPTTTGGTLQATASEKARASWVAVSTGAIAPTVAQVIAGINYGAVTVVASGQGALPAGAAGSLALTGLSEGSSYVIYLAVQDAAGNLVSAVSQASLSTTSTPSAPITSLPSSGGSTLLQPGETLVVTDSGGIGSTIQLGSGGSTTITSGQIQLPGTGTVLVSGSGGALLQVGQILGSGGISTMVLTVSQGSATFTASQSGQPLGLASGMILVTGNQAGAQATITVGGANPSPVVNTAGNITITIVGAPLQVAGSSLQLVGSGSGGQPVQFVASTGSMPVTLTPGSSGAVFTVQPVTGSSGSLTSALVVLSGGVSVTVPGSGFAGFAAGNQPILGSAGTSFMASGLSGSQSLWVGHGSLMLPLTSFLSTRLAMPSVRPALGDGSIYAGETVVINGQGAVLSAFLGSPDGWQGVLGDALAQPPSTPALTLQLRVPRLDGLTARNGMNLAVQQSQAWAALGLQPGAAQSGGVLELRSAEHRFLALPVGRVGLDLNRVDGAQVRNDGLIELSTGGFIVTYAPGLADYADLAARLQGQTTVGYDGLLTVRLAGDIYVTRPAWDSRDCGEAGVQVVAGSIRYGDGRGDCRLLQPTVAEVPSLASLLGSLPGLGGWQVGADGVVQLTLDGVGYRLRPDYLLQTRPAAHAQDAGWIGSDGRVYLGLQEGRSQGFAVEVVAP